MKDEQAIDELNKILRGELSAIETYLQALEKVEDSQPEGENLRGVLADHEDAAEKIKDHITGLGGIPSTDSGAWGAWAKTVEGTAKLFGDSAAIMALKEGEKHGQSEYEELIANEEFPSLIKEDLKIQISKQREHIMLLEKFL